MYYNNNKQTNQNLCEELKMKDYINNLLQELNSISRMAVIENAFVTERMISIYSNILRYRWNGEGREVTAAKEMDIVLKCCELFRLKNNDRLIYEYEENSEIKTIFIPHYTIIACIKSMLAVIERTGRQFKVQIKVNRSDETTWIHFVLTGQIDFENVLDRVDHCGEIQEYEDFNEAVRRWKERFGEDSLKTTLYSRSKGQLDMSFGCR